MVVDTANESWEVVLSSWEVGLSFAVSTTNWLFAWAKRDAVKVAY